MQTQIGKPFQSGHDPRRVIPNNTGKQYRNRTERLLDELLLTPGGKIEGQPASKHAVLVYLLTKDGIDPNLPAIDRHRAAKEVLDRLDGRTITPVELSGSVQHTLAGKAWNELTSDELTRIIASPERYSELNGVIVEAEFTDISNSASGESGSPVTIPMLTEPTD